MLFSIKTRPSWIIHIFAILHAIVAIFCRLGGVEDELLLTILTIAMVLVICYQKKLSIEFTAAIVIVGNIIGYLMGTLGARMLGLLFDSPVIVHALSTTVTTEVLGWSIVMITRLFRQSHPEQRSDSVSSSYIRWILLAAVGILVIRLGIVFFLSHDTLDTTNILEITGKVLSNSVGIIILICLNVIYVRYIAELCSGLRKWKRTVIFIIFMVLASFVEVLIVRFGFDADLKLLIMVCVLAQITVYCIVFMINYAATSRSEMHRQKEKAHLAQYRYLKLKRQVNPHFLFNSLNILDCLVCEEKTEQASTYIHKLAGIYRYMIKSEDDEIVPLRDELTFVNLYVDLLMVRFPVGFHVEIKIPEDLMSRSVLPCSLQLLIENAIKHNAVTESNPLVIKIEADGTYVHVSNNIIPKVTVSPSTGLGQKYIRRQYMDLSGKEIEIKRTEDRYCVTLPLL